MSQDLCDDVDIDDKKCVFICVVNRLTTYLEQHPHTLKSNYHYTPIALWVWVSNPATRQKCCSLYGNIVEKITWKTTVLPMRIQKYIAFIDGRQSQFQSWVPDASYLVTGDHYETTNPAVQ